MRLTSCLAGVAALGLVATATGAKDAPQIQLLPFFFTVDLNLNQDGSGTMALSYPSTPVTNFDTERARFASATTNATDVQIRGMLVYTTVAFSDVTRLSDIPELSNIKAERETEKDGTQLVKARLRSPVSFLGDLRSDAKVTIKVTVPGKVLKSNSQESSANTVVWKAPAKQFFKEEGIQIQLSYKPETDNKAKS